MVTLHVYRIYIKYKGSQQRLNKRMNYDQSWHATVFYKHLSDNAT